MTVPAVTRATGKSLQRLAEQAWERMAAGSVLYFEGTRWTGARAGRAGPADHRRAARARACGPASGSWSAWPTAPRSASLYQAVWRAGAVVTPVLFLLSEAELRHVLTDSGAAFVGDHAGVPAQGPWLRRRARRCAAIIVCRRADRGVRRRAAAAATSRVWRPPRGGAGRRGPDGLAALLYTGGTTGRSKGVMISQQRAVRGVLGGDTHSSYGSGAGTALLPLPLSHVYGLMVSVMALHRRDPGHVGADALVRPGGLAAAGRRAPGAGQPAGAVDAAMLLQQPLEDYDLSALRGSSLRRPRRCRAGARGVRRRVPGVEVAEGYGCTESAAIISTTPIGQVRPGCGRQARARGDRADRTAGRLRRPAPVRTARSASAARW